MSRHRALRTKVRRGIATWPVAIVGLVVLLVLGWLGWSWVGGLVERRAAAQAGDCDEGDALLRIASTPSIAEAVKLVAEAWSGTRPVVYDHCILIEVQSIDSEVVLGGLTQGWDTATIGERPHAWVTDSMLWANRLGAQNGVELLQRATDQNVRTPIILLTGQNDLEVDLIVQIEQIDLTGAGINDVDLLALIEADAGLAQGRRDAARRPVVAPLRAFAVGRPVPPVPPQLHWSPGQQLRR